MLNLVLGVGVLSLLPSKTGRFLSKAEILEVGVFSPKSNSEVPQKFPRLPWKFPAPPQKLPGLPAALSVGSLTPSDDSQRAPLSSATIGTVENQGRPKHNHNHDLQKKFCI